MQTFKELNGIPYLVNSSRLPKVDYFILFFFVYFFKFKPSFVFYQDEQCNNEFDREEFHNNAVIVDAMAVIQALKGKWKTFGELCDAIFSSI